MNVRRILRLLPMPLVLMLLLVLGLLPGCTQETPLNGRDYVERLARVLDVDAPAQTNVSRGTDFPRVRKLRVTYSDASLDLLEYLSMSECRLQQVVAEKNSSLGRVADATGRLRQDLQFLQYAEDCVTVLEPGDPELAIRLKAAVAAKQEELPKRIFEATLGSDAFRTFWQSDYSGSVDAEVQQALDQLVGDVQRWLGGDYTGHEMLESQLRLISTSSGGGLLAAWDESATVLAVASQVAEDRMNSKPLCYPDMKTAEADVFFRVVSRFFVGGIQKQLSATNRSTYDVMRAVHGLESQLTGVMPDAYRQWQTDRDHRIEAGRSALVSHVEALEPLMQQCGFLPQNEEDT